MKITDWRFIQSSTTWLTFKVGLPFPNTTCEQFPRWRYMWYKCNRFWKRSIWRVRLAHICMPTQSVLLFFFLHLIFCHYYPTIVCRGMTHLSANASSRRKTSVPRCLGGHFERVDSAGEEVREIDNKEKWVRRHRERVWKDGECCLSVVSQLCGVSVSRRVSVSHRILLWLSKRLSATPPPPHPLTAQCCRAIGSQGAVDLPRTLCTQVSGYLSVRVKETNRCTPVCCKGAQVKKKKKEGMCKSEVVVMSGSRKFKLFSLHVVVIKL